MSDFAPFDFAVHTKSGKVWYGYAGNLVTEFSVPEALVNNVAKTINTGGNLNVCRVGTGSHAYTPPRLTRLCSTGVEAIEDLRPEA